MMLKRLISRLFCDHEYYSSIEPYYIEDFDTGLKVEKIICKKCNKRTTNTYIEV